LSNNNNRSTFDAIAELIGQKIVDSVMDEKDYRIMEEFADMFTVDNPTTFDKVRFRDAAYYAHSRKKKESSSSSNTGGGGLEK
jgi:hypothetical protein